jgi:dihydrofolate synthase/folylpolyglutamate synthase
MDHQQHLGSTIEAIAREKAGIIKPGMTVVAGELPEDAMAVVRQTVRERGATLVVASEDVQADAALEDGRARVTLRTPVAAYGPVPLALRGAHQVGSAIVAVRLLEAAQQKGVPVTTAGIEEGLSQTEWPARLELLTLENGRRVLIDAAHNSDGAQALATYLGRWHPEPVALVISVMRDKDVDAILALLVAVTGDIVATEAPSPRAMPADELAARVAALQRRSGRAVSVSAVAEPAQAVEEALDRNETVCIAGSIFLAGAVRDALKQRAILL